jgi:uncharacterized repeat protein (TIGR03803 family)
VLASFLVRGNKSEAALTFDAAGNLYGTTAGGHGQGYGTVFKLSPPAAGKASWTQTVLFDFKGPNGAGPQAGLILDSAGNLYGTTNAGGNPSCPASYNGHGCGLVFKLTP